MTRLIILIATLAGISLSGTSSARSIALHAGYLATYWVDATGSDTNPCTESSPCKTISFVLSQKAANGDVIKINPGIYREQVDISLSDVILEGTGEGVFVFGAEVPDLIAAEGKYKADWTWGTSFQSTNLCSNLTNDVATSASMCNTLGFWQNGERLMQVLSKSAVTDGTFYYDFGTETVWLKPVTGNDNLAQIEGLAESYVVKLTSASRRVTLKNLNIWYGASKPDDGILIVEGAGHHLEDLDVRYSAGGGVQVFGADDVSMDNVRAIEHGQNGWRVRADASFSTSTGWDVNDTVDNLTVTNSTSEHNGWKAYDNCWGGGGTKFSFTNNLNIDSFYSADNLGFGIWLDIYNYAYTIGGSMSARDAGRGIFVEYISDDGLVENNVVFGTREADTVGCAVSVGLAAADSRNVMLRNNTVYATEDDVKGMLLKTGCPTCRSFPYESQDITWENNLLINKADVGFVRDLNVGSLGSFVFDGTVIEEGGGNVFTCWDGLGSCTQSALGIDTVPSGTYLADEDSECGFETVDAQVAGKGATGFAHPRGSEICGTPPPPNESPTVAFTYMVNELSVEFTDTSTDDGVIVAWSWDFGDGGLSIEQHPAYIYSAAGDYTVSLTVTDDAGLNSSTSQTITATDPVNPIPPTAAFTFLANAFSVDFTDASTDDGVIVAWSWDFGDGGLSIEQHPSYTYSAAGDYTVSLTVTDDAGLSSSTSQSVTITDPVDPIPPIAAFTFLANAFSVDFTDASTDDGVIVAWSWDFGDGGVSIEQHPVYAYSAAGDYTVSLTVTDDAGLSSSTSQSVTIMDPVDPIPPVAAFTLVANELSVEFTDASTDNGAIVSWSWDFGDGGISAEQHPVYTYSAAGDYTVSLTVTDDEGLTGVAIQDLTVEASLPPGGGAFIESAGMVVMEAEHAHANEPGLITNDSWVLEDVNFDGEAVLSMQPQIDDGDFVRKDFRTDNATLSYDIDIENTGTYYIWLRVWPLEDGSSVYVGCDGYSMRMGVSSSEIPASEWLWIGMKNPGLRAQVDIPAAGGKVFNLWMREDGLYVDRILLTTDEAFVPQGTGPEESPQMGGNASIAAHNKVALFHRSDNTIHASAEADELPTLFEVKGTYPNPAHTQVQVLMDLPEASEVAVSIYDMTGRLRKSLSPVYVDEGVDRRVAVDLADLPAGVYVYRLSASEWSGVGASGVLVRR